MSTVIVATIRLTEAPPGNVVYAGGMFVPGVVLAAVNIAGCEIFANDPEARLNENHNFST